ncbi:ABC transporter permease subunit [Stenotrophomonas sepilia]|uniref:ABC transporter permease subunit n=1 Tax=Stenotrophomonas sepilia TaxID=2860290 RepID=UPI002E775BE5|nr:ABC transporter permease subunit [Stenotrophomonas sepilia]
MSVAGLKRWLPGLRATVIGIPYLWLLLFFAVPFLIVLMISFSLSWVGSPPYTWLLQYVDGGFSLKLNLENYLALFRDSIYAQAFLSSIRIAAISTFLTLLIGYPMAYAIARLSPAARNVAMMLVVLPSWTSFLIRVYAWKAILDRNGLLDQFLQFTGLQALMTSMGLPKLQLIDTPTAAYIGIVYCYLPFMVLPLYANLVKHDHRLLEAAYDLGAKPWQAFLRITLPLSKAGIIAGCMLVMIPAVGEFVIPEMLGGSETLMVGRQLWNEFFNNRNWPGASAMAVAMILLLLVPILLFNRSQQRLLEGKQA